MVFADAGNGWPQAAADGKDRAMNAPAPRAAGFFIAVAVVAGGVVGGRLGQTSIGVLAGLAAGATLALLLWLIDRRLR